MAHHHHHHHEHSHYHIHSNERSTRLVVILSFLTMLLELYFGYLANSRALVMDGWHMLSHVLVLLLAWLAYVYIQRRQGKISHARQHRVIALAGFGSAVVMLVITGLMIYETIEKFTQQQLEVGNDTLLIAAIGLVVNGVSAYFLHREEETTDVNMRAAYLHVLSDVVLSLFAILSLLAARYGGVTWLDPLLAMVGALVILRWAVGLISKSWNEVVSGE